MITTALCILSLALWQAAVHGQTIRVEFDPDPTTVTGPCSDAFMTSLSAQISFWFTDGVSSFHGVFPEVANPYLTFNNTVKRNGNANRVLPAEKEDDEKKAQAKSAVKEQTDRNLCSWTTCNNCCPAYCSSWCTNGSCGNLCGGGRNLREGVQRRTDSTTTAWWWGNETMQFSVAKAIQFAAQQWLSGNDETKCMGNAWKLQVQLNFF